MNVRMQLKFMERIQMKGNNSRKSYLNICWNKCCCSSETNMDLTTAAVGTAIVSLTETQILTLCH